MCMEPHPILTTTAPLHPTEPLVCAPVGQPSGKHPSDLLASAWRSLGSQGISEKRGPRNSGQQMSPSKQDRSSHLVLKGNQANKPGPELGTPPGPNPWKRPSKRRAINYPEAALEKTDRRRGCNTLKRAHRRWTQGRGREKGGHVSIFGICLRVAPNYFSYGYDIIYILYIPSGSVFMVGEYYAYNKMMYIQIFLVTEQVLIQELETFRRCTRHLYVASRCTCH